MKKKILLLLTILSIVFVGNVYAEGPEMLLRYDFGNVKLTHRNGGHTQQYIDIEGVEDIVAHEESYLCWAKSDMGYPFVGAGPYVMGVPQYIVHTGDIAPDVNDTVEHHCFALEYVADGKIQPVNVSKFGRWFYEEDYNNFYLVKTRPTYTTVPDPNADPNDPYTGNNVITVESKMFFISSPMKVKRANYKTGSVNSVTIRAKGNEDGTNSIIKVRTPYENTGLKRHIKIVKIEDESILKAVAKNEDGAYDTLKRYIKSNDGYTAQQKYSEKELDTSDLVLVDGAYYGIYIYYNTNDRLDYTDIVISKAEKNGTLLSGNADLSAFAEETKGEEDSSTSGNKKSTSNNEKNPKTGLANYYWIAPVVVLLVGSLFVIIKKNKLFKSI